MPTVKKSLSLAIIIDTALNFPPLTGVTYRLYYLSKALVDNGMKVKIFCCNRNIKKDSDVRQLRNSSNIDIHIIPKQIFYDVPELSHIIGQYKIDIIQVEDAVSVLRYLPIAQKMGIPLCLEMHDIEPKIMNIFNRPAKQIQSSIQISKSAGRLAEQILCMVPADAKELIKKFGVNPHKIMISPNPIDCSEFKVFGPNIKANNLLFIGNMYYLPNQLAAQKILEKIYPKIHKEYPDINFTFVGMVPKKFKSKYKNKNKILFTEQVNNLDQYLKNASLALCPVFSGSGMKVKILNYCAAGLPIITTGIGASGYGAITSLIIENDINKYHRLIIKLLANKKKLKRIGMMNRRLVKKYYDVNIIAKNIIKRYQALKSAHKLIPPISPSIKKLPMPMWLAEKRIQKIKNNTYYIIRNEKIISKQKIS